MPTKITVIDVVRPHQHHEWRQQGFAEESVHWGAVPIPRVDKASEMLFKLSAPAEEQWISSTIHSILLTHSIDGFIENQGLIIQEQPEERTQRQQQPQQQQQQQQHQQQQPQLATLQAFVVAVVPVATAIVSAVAVWLGAKGGRKVRVKIGDIEIEASNAEEMVKIMPLVEAIQHQSKPEPTKS